MTRFRPTATPAESAEWLARVALDWHGEPAPEAGRPFVLPFYVLTTSVSRSGLSRRARAFCPTSRRTIAELSWHVAALLKMTVSERDEITLPGCGMDVHFWLAELTQRKLREFYPNATVEKVTL